MAGSDGDDTSVRVTGLRRGRTYPATAARHLLNPLRRIVQPPGRIVGRMKIAPSDRVLEIGCGPGWFTPTLSAATPNGSVIAADLQHEMVTICRARTADAANVFVVRADAMALPFAPATFDAVLLVTVLGETSDPGRCLHEIARLLAPVGSVTVCETRRDSDFVPLARLTALASEAGLVLASRHGSRVEYTARFVRNDAPPR